MACAHEGCESPARQHGRYCSDRCCRAAYRLRLKARDGESSGRRCACGCGRETRIFNGKPNRFLVGHNYRAKVVDKYFVDFETGCWNWAGGLSKGRGIVMRDGRQMQAHRWMYLRVIGPIPDGHELHHVCRNGRCVNPAHLQPITPTEHGRLHRIEQLAV